jgi:hypothetical protein
MTRDEFVAKGIIYMYDVGIDEFRAATQDDIDRCLGFITAFARAVQISEDPAIVEAKAEWKEFMDIARAGADSNGN